MKSKKKVHSKSGFTLGETLLAILILLMVSMIVANGIPVAKSAYDKVVTASNAEVLLTNTINVLRNELGTAQSVKVDTDNNSIEYYNPTRDSYSVISLNGDDDEPANAIMIQRYATPPEIPGLVGYNPSDPVRLISGEASTNHLYSTYQGVGYSNGIVTFYGIDVYQESRDTPVSSKNTLNIRVISEQ